MRHHKSLDVCFLSMIFSLCSNKTSHLHDNWGDSLNFWFRVLYGAEGTATRWTFLQGFAHQTTHGHVLNVAHHNDHCSVYTKNDDSMVILIIIV